MAGNVICPHDLNAEGVSKLKPNSDDILTEMQGVSLYNRWENDIPGQDDADT
jgi:hypothetical protein